VLHRTRFGFRSLQAADGVGIGIASTGPRGLEEQMKRRILLGAVLAVLGLAVAGDGWVYAAKCTPHREGTCRACSNCKYCKHCAKDGGRCSVCK